MSEITCLVVYYSRTGYTKKVAETIAGMLNCEVEAVVEKKDRGGAKGYFGGIKDMLFNKTADIEKPRFDPSDYDLTIIGTPVWGNKVSLPVQSWFNSVRKPLPASAFFLTTKFSGIEYTFQQMTELSGREPAAKLALTDGRIKKEGWEKDVAEFVEKIRNKLP